MGPIFVVHQIKNYHDFYITVNIVRKSITVK